MLNFNESKCAQNGHPRLSFCIRQIRHQFLLANCNVNITDHRIPCRRAGDPMTWYRGTQSITTSDFPMKFSITGTAIFLIIILTLNFLVFPFPCRLLFTLSYCILSLIFSGKNCMRWDSVSNPIFSSKFDEYDAPSPLHGASATRSQGVHAHENYCRNPDNWRHGPWCIVEVYLHRRCFTLGDFLRGLDEKAREEMAEENAQLAFVMSIGAGCFIETSGPGMVPL
uniref:Kringle domain-containing protein n=1 Tax=Parascaris equorum TaxID=6256 RepID=A0A914RZ03_PAREQ